LLYELIDWNWTEKRKLTCSSSSCSRGLRFASPFKTREKREKGGVFVMSLLLQLFDFLLGLLSTIIYPSSKYRVPLALLETQQGGIQKHVQFVSVVDLLVHALCDRVGCCSLVAFFQSFLDFLEVMVVYA